LALSPAQAPLYGSQVPLRQSLGDAQTYMHEPVSGRQTRPTPQSASRVHARWHRPPSAIDDCALHIAPAGQLPDRFGLHSRWQNPPARPLSSSARQIAPGSSHFSSQVQARPALPASVPWHDGWGPPIVWGGAPMVRGAGAGGRSTPDGKRRDGSSETRLMSLSDSELSARRLV
jgi:hypothetical protein